VLTSIDLLCPLSPCSMDANTVSNTSSSPKSAPAPAVSKAAMAAPQGISGAPKALMVQSNPAAATVAAARTPSIVPTTMVVHAQAGSSAEGPLKDKLRAPKALQPKPVIEKHDASASGGTSPFLLPQELSHFLQHESFMSVDMTKSKRASLRKTAKTFAWKNGQLFKCLGPDVYRQVPTASMIAQVFAWCHDQGHPGQVSTYNRVRKTFWWDGMKKDCYNYVRSCVTCQKQHDPSVRTDRDMRPVPVTGLLPFQKVAIDLAGPLPKTHSGFKHILVVVCYLTKWVEAIPLVNNKATTCAEVFVREIIARYGCPLEVVSDNGHSFNGKFFDCMTLWGIHNLRVAPYHPQSNGLVERCIQTIKRALSCMTGTKPTTWDKMLGWVLFTYRQSQQKTTGFSPFFLLFGREALMPEQLSLMTENLVIDEESGLQKYLDSLLATAHDMQDTLEKAQDNVALSQEQQRQDFVIRRQSQTRRIVAVQNLEPGALLLAKRPHSQVTGLTQSWRGPYTLLRFLTDAKKSALLQEVKTGKKVRRAVAQLKPFSQPEPFPSVSAQAPVTDQRIISLPSSR
jgi:hypothetical protein